MITGYPPSCPASCRAMPSACRRLATLLETRLVRVPNSVRVKGTPKRIDHDFDEETLVAPHRAARRWCHAGPSATRCNDPGRHCIGTDGGVSKDAHGILLHPARRDPGQYRARPGDGSLDADGFWYRLQAESDPGIARALQALRHLVRESSEPGHGGRSAQPGAGYMAERHATG